MKKEKPGTMKTIQELLKCAEEKTREDMMTMIRERAGYSGYSAEEVKRWLNHYQHLYLWYNITYMASKLQNAEDYEVSAEMLLLELHKRGVSVDPCQYVPENYIVKMKNSEFKIIAHDGYLIVDESMSPGGVMSIRAEYIAELMIEFDRMVEYLPEYCEEIIHHLEAEGKEREMVSAIANGLVKDLIDGSGAVLELKHTSYRFSFSLDGVNREFSCRLADLREIVTREIWNIRRQK